MPKTKLVFFAVRNQMPSLKKWLATIPDKALDKCTVKMERLEELGHELRRPEADYLRNEIYELRMRHQNINYRILYFFHGQLVVLYSGLTKEDLVPPIEIDRAIIAKKLFSRNPNKYTYHGSEQ